jgi:hypothetical protein
MKATIGKFFATTVSAMIVLLCLLPAAYADNHGEVMDAVKRYANLEGNLAEQAKLIRSDRVMITGVRQSDQAKNLEIQLAARNAMDAANGGEARWITEIESPEIRMYGDVAVASMMRIFHIYPPDQPPINAPPHWLTLVLVRENGKWGIAHSHISPLWEPAN